MPRTGLRAVYVSVFAHILADLWGAAGAGLLWKTSTGKQQPRWCASIGRSLTTKSNYQQPDEATMLSVVLGGAELREKKA
jgi:membrane-bound metal-dependent hydrolase YbcI (DUF457 family)